MFFFFKQKTAYEMRISDWSSDVCSSDLSHHARTQEGQRGLRPRQGQLGTSRARPVETDRNQPGGNRRIQGALCHPVRASSGWLGRSEEHTSELQSLMRISYAVFCLKKKKKQKNNKSTKAEQVRSIKRN